jgi:hypothetical protein
MGYLSFLKSKQRLVIVWMVGLMIMPWANISFANAQESRLTTAVFPLTVTGQETGLIKQLLSKVREKEIENPDTMGDEFSLLLSTHLSGTFGIPLVERAELEKVLSEIELGLSGTVDTMTASKVGKLTGAKVIVSGRMFQVQNNMVVVTKTIGVETSRVLAHTVTIPKRGSILDAAQLLASKIADGLTAKGNTLVAKDTPKYNPIEKLQTVMKDYNSEDLPVLSIQISEKSMNRDVLDPAAETELGFILQSLGFTLVDPLSTNTPPDIQIEGEAFSEMGLRRGNLVSSKGRVEVKAIERLTGKVLAVDRQMDVAVDLSPEISGKAALQNAASNLSERLIMEILKSVKKQ